MRWEDMTIKFREELDAAMFHKVVLGDTQHIVEIIQGIQKESFFEGMKYAVEILQDIITRGVIDND